MKASLQYLIVLFLLTSCMNTSDQNKVAVFCASSMTDVLTQFADKSMREDYVGFKMNLASSGTLARQIELGNPADIYISANKHWADYVDSLGLFSERKLLYNNQLVLIAPLHSALDSIDIQSGQAPMIDGYLSMGDPDHVPAGKYALQTLKNLDWWEDYSEKHVPAKDVRSALMQVELGECELGVVFYSDALVSKKVKIVATFPDTLHAPIHSHVLLSKNASEAALKVYQNFTDTTFQSFWTKYGLSLAE